MKKNFDMKWLILSSLLFITAQLSAQSNATPANNSGETPITTSVSSAEFRPRIILMPSSALFFEVGMPIPITRGQAREALDASYTFIQAQMTSAEGTPIIQKMEETAILRILLNARYSSIAQAFGRLQDNRQYIYLNVFPASSVSSDSLIQNREWRVTSGGPAFWRIRYDLETKEVFGFSYDRFLR
jgi:hypothetical protein